MPLLGCPAGSLFQPHLLAESVALGKCAEPRPDQRLSQPTGIGRAPLASSGARPTDAAPHLPLHGQAHIVGHCVVTHNQDRPQRSVDACFEPHPEGTMKTWANL